MTAYLFTKQGKVLLAIGVAVLVIALLAVAQAHGVPNLLAVVPVLAT